MKSGSCVSNRLPYGIILHQSSLIHVASRALTLLPPYSPPPSSLAADAGNGVDAITKAARDVSSQVCDTCDE